MAHVARHDDAPSHLKAPQLCEPAPHAPRPSHVPASVSVEDIAGQDADEQPVPVGHFWQPPAPSHLPSVPQVDAVCVAQKVAGAVVPAATGAHVPALPPTLHALHAPHGPESQHTPSVQLALPHWSAAVHAVPSASFGAHAPRPVQ